MARPNSPFGPDVELIMDLSRPDVLPMTLYALLQARLHAIFALTRSDRLAVTARHA